MNEIVNEKLEVTEVADIAAKNGNKDIALAILKVAGADTVKLFLGNRYFNAPYMRGCIYKATRQDKKEGFYKPRISLNDFGLNFEASLPKLYQGTNLYELMETDKTVIAEQIEAHCSAAGIKLHDNWIDGTRIRRVDFAKTIRLPQGVKVINILNHLQNADVKGQKSVGNIRYNGGGENLVIGNASRMLSIYNKSAEILTESRKNNEFPLDNILDDIKNGFELIRIELRLTAKKSVHDEFMKIGVRTPTLNDVFNASFANSLIIREFRGLVNSVAKQYVDKDYSDTQLLYKLAETCSKKSARQILSSFALSVLEKDMTRQEIKLMFIKLFGAAKAKYFLRKTASQKYGGINDMPISKVIGQLCEMLSAWQPLNLADSSTTKQTEINKGEAK